MLPRTYRLYIVTHYVSLKPTVKFLEKWTQEFFISHASVTLNESQCQLNLYQNVDLNSFYHHNKFERNQSLNVWTQANVDFFLMKSFNLGFLPWKLNGPNKNSMRFIKLTNLNSGPHSIQTDRIICEIIGTEVFAFSLSCAPESRSRSFRLV